MSTMIPTNENETLPARETVRMLAPSAYSEIALPSLRLARSSRLARTIGRILFVSLIVGTLIVAFAPWRQFVRASGNVVAYDPKERMQEIESPIKNSQIVRFGDNIFENAHVVKDQLIAEVADIDPFLLSRLEDQRTAMIMQEKAAEQALEASMRGVKSATEVVAATQAQLEAYRNARVQILEAADSKIQAALDKVEAERQKLAENQAAYEQERTDYNRQKTLFEEDIASELDFQKAERKLNEYTAKVAMSRANISAAENNLKAERSERNAKAEKTRAEIDEVSAKLNKAAAEVAKAESEVAKAKATITKATKDRIDAESKLERQKKQEIRAPFDGFLTRITANQGGRLIKQGESIATIVPDTADRAVQVWLDGNDASLVRPGRHVRLQFEGWPAIQFAGWPSVAVGTFGGEIVSVDANDDGKGKFRALVLPDKTSGAWPDERYLRQGVRANAWVILDRVPLWFEIWRNMNAFPPVVSEEEPKEKTKQPKLPKP